MTFSLTVSCFLLALLQRASKKGKCHHSSLQNCMLERLRIVRLHGGPLKQAGPVAARQLHFPSHCVYSYWIEALLSAEALPVIGCLWQGSQLFRETGKGERSLSQTPGSWDWLVLYQVVTFRAQMSPQGHGCLLIDHHKGKWVALNSSAVSWYGPRFFFHASRPWSSSCPQTVNPARTTKCLFCMCSAVYEPLLVLACSVWQIATVTGEWLYLQWWKKWNNHITSIATFRATWLYTGKHNYNKENTANKKAESETE